MTPKLRILVSVVAGIVSIQAIAGVLIYSLNGDWPTRGQFGDMFGAVNALFSGLAFAGLIYTVLLQREELSLQREELKLTRRELERSAAAQEKSESALRDQAKSAAQSARLAAVNALLDHYRREVQAFHGQSFTGDDPRHAQLQELRARERALVETLDHEFSNLTGGGS